MRETLIAEYTVGIISIIGNFFVILLYLCFKDKRSFPFESVMYLNISSMLTTFSYIFYYYDPDTVTTDHTPTLCTIQSILMLTFENSMFLWGTIIGYSVYKSVVFFEADSDGDSNCRTRTKNIVIGYAIPVLITIICYLADVLGPSGNYCWIDTDSPRSHKSSKDTLKDVFSWIIYSFVWVLIIINFILNYSTIRLLNNLNVSLDEKKKIRAFSCKLIRFPIIQIICVIPGTVNRFIAIFYTSSNIPVLQSLQLYFTLTEGLLFAIAYGYNDNVRSILVNTIEKYCCCRNNIYRVDSEKSSLRSLYDRTNNPSENITVDFRF